jgi:glutathione S-transferase
MLIFHDYVLSSDSYKIRLLLTLLGLPHDRRLIDLYPGRANTKHPYLEVSPMGDVPALEDGDLKLWGAEPILFHLANSYDPSASWLPKDPSTQAAIVNWLSFATRHLQPVTDARAHDLLGLKIDIETAQQTGRYALRALDDYLVHREFDGGTWLVSSTPTIADIACFAPTVLAGDGGITVDEFPALRTWLRAFRALPNFHAMAGVPEFL